ncbi:MAG TPA: hypothetical protein VM370_09870 [Candidatus Thermoplasmatota archaeon]|nr:hypothetical protein [Candidatus Thermoplasmatota archaeon]
MRGALLVCALLLLVLLPSVAAQDGSWAYEGGAPGVEVSAAGSAIDGESPERAIPVDPTAPLALSIRVSPTDGTTWTLREIDVALLLGGPGSRATPAMERSLPSDSVVPPGWSVVVNRTADLGALRRVGAGTFLMEARVVGADGALLHAQPFFVRVAASAAALLTLQGALLAALTLAAGYGLWQILRDLKEIRDARERHRRRERARPDVVGAAEAGVKRALAKGGGGLARAVDVYDAMGEEEKGVGVLKWSATGLGLGGVALSWLQFLGYVALDLSRLLAVALAAGGAFLLLALLARALVKRHRRAAALAADNRD